MSRYSYNKAEQTTQEMSTYSYNEAEQTTQEMSTYSYNKAEQTTQGNEQVLLQQGRTNDPGKWARTPTTRPNKRPREMSRYSYNKAEQTTQGNEQVLLQQSRTNDPGKWARTPTTRPNKRPREMSRLHESQMGQTEAPLTTYETKALERKKPKSIHQQRQSHSIYSFTRCFNSIMYSWICALLNISDWSISRVLNTQRDTYVFWLTNVCVCVCVCVRACETERERVVFECVWGGEGGGHRETKNCCCFLNT